MNQKTCGADSSASRQTAMKIMSGNYRSASEWRIGIGRFKPEGEGRVENAARQAGAGVFGQELS